MSIKPYYEEDGITIYCGDCRDVLPHLPEGCSVVSDPPYGMAWNGKVSVGKGGHGQKGVISKPASDGIKIEGDDKPFDPSPWLSYERVILFGSNHFAAKLPVGTTLVWVKRLDGAFGTFLSDAEVAWMKGGHGVYCFRDTSMMAEANHRKHPSQKPLPLMRWCIKKIRDDSTILDPFMGSGTTLVAAKQLGRKAIGIELEEKYCRISVDRLRQGVLPL